MPELPEVETVVRDLRPLLVGRVITSVRQSKRKLRRPWKREWNSVVAGMRIEAVRRRGKWILIDLVKPTPPAPLPAGREVDPTNSHPVANAPGSPVSSRGMGSSDNPILRIHLGMSGQFTVVPAATPEPDHLHVVYSLDDENELRFRDPRRFGSAEYASSRTALEEEMNAELGPEPFGIDAEYFRSAVRGTSRNLKAILLDQTTVAGVGNIYADEACFRAKLHPGRKGKSLSPEECDRLRESIESVMNRAIETRGSTIRDYVGGSGLRGGFQNEFAVYGRTDEPCPECSTPIKCARFAGRSSHFCPVCQTITQRKPSSKTNSKKTVLTIEAQRAQRKTKRY